MTSRVVRMDDVTKEITIAAGAVATVDITDANITLAKIANAAANSKLLGSGAAGAGASYSELTLGTNLSMSGTTLNATGGSGSVATDTIWDAKGDTVGGTGADAAARLAVGDDYSTYSPDSSATNGLAWRQFSQEFKIPTVSQIIGANMSVVMNATLKLNTGITVTISDGATLRIMA